MSATPTQPAPAAINGASKVEPVNVPDQKANLKAARRPKPSPHFVQSAPPSLVQALFSYDAITSAESPEQAAPDPKPETHSDSP
jgi:hypothetical protein